MKDEGAGRLTDTWATQSPPPKAAEQKEENIIREVILPYVDRQIATAEKKVSIPERS